MNTKMQKDVETSVFQIKNNITQIVGEKKVFRYLTFNSISKYMSF